MLVVWWFGYCVFCYFFWLAVYVLRGVLLMFLGLLLVGVVGLGLDVFDGDGCL